jgi:hypothetical protein
MYSVITLESAALDTTIKWPFWLHMLQLNAHQRSVPFENLTSLPVCSTFIWSVTKHNV